MFRFSKINKNHPPTTSFIEYFAFRSEERKFKAALQRKRRLKAENDKRF